MDAIDLILTYGFSGTIIIMFLFLGIKYIPKFIDASLEKAKKKDYREELYLEAIRNNTQVIENNNAIIKSYTNNSHKLEENVKELTNTFKLHDTRAESMASDIKVIKERGK